MNATIFEIERYATEDGPGIRTVVFFKGCNLRCRWCQNPESHVAKPQIMYSKRLCVACGRCVAACPEGAIERVDPYGFVTDHSRCTRCGKCVEACYTGARSIVGRVATIDEIMDEIDRDRSYYRESGGGVTFSGGEPLLQPDAVAELARRCRDAGIHTAIETASHASWETAERLFRLMDLVFIDLKHIDSEAHRRFTGVPLDRIQDNIRKTSETDVSLIVRIPVVPGVNATESIQREMFTFLAEGTQVKRVQLLPFHRLGVTKYEGLGMHYEMSTTDNLSKSDCEPFAEIGREMGLTVQVGAEGA